jgi:hypothetical protein
VSPGAAETVSVSVIGCPASTTFDPPTSETATGWKSAATSKGGSSRTIVSGS